MISSLLKSRTSRSCLLESVCEYHRYLSIFANFNHSLGTTIKHHKTRSIKYQQTFVHWTKTLSYRSWLWKTVYDLPVGMIGTKMSRMSRHCLGLGSSEIPSNLLLLPSLSQRQTSSSIFLSPSAACTPAGTRFWRNCRIFYCHQTLTTLRRNSSALLSMVLVGRERHSFVLNLLRKTEKGKLFRSAAKSQASANFTKIEASGEFFGLMRVPMSIRNRPMLRLLNSERWSQTTAQQCTGSPTLKRGGFC